MPIAIGLQGENDNDIEYCSYSITYLLDATLPSTSTLNVVNEIRAYVRAGIDNKSKYFKKAGETISEHVNSWELPTEKPLNMQATDDGADIAATLEVGA